MARKIRVIVNRAARSGGKQSLVEQVRRELRDFDLELVIPETYEELVERARSAPAEGVDTVVAVGGDGTVNAVINQLANTDVALGVVPAGTANDLAQHLGIPKDVTKACDLIRRGQRRELDLVEINGRYFVTAGGMGVVSDTAVGVNQLKASDTFVSRASKKLGSLVYVLYSFGILARKKRLASEIQVSVDGEDHGSMASVALFVNNQPSIGGRVVPFPGARSDDGELGVCVVKPRSRLGTMLSVILMSLKGRHTSRKDIKLMAGKRITIKAPTKKLFIGDGEVLAHTRTLSLNVVPKALKVLS